MSPTTVQTFYGLLAAAGVIAIAVIWFVRGAALVSASARGVDHALAGSLGPSAVLLALVVAILATGGSLYFSEVAGYAPCTLCWYQRIAMYPLVVILGVAAIRRDRSGVPAAIVLAAIGAVIAAYHVALEWIPALDTGACDATAPCTVVWFRALGVFSLPTLALVAFLLIITMLTVRATAPDPERSRS